MCFSVMRWTVGCVFLKIYVHKNKPTAEKRGTCRNHGKQGSSIKHIIQKWTVTWLILSLKLSTVMRAYWNGCVCYSSGGSWLWWFGYFYILYSAVVPWRRDELFLLKHCPTNKCLLSYFTSAFVLCCSYTTASTPKSSTSTVTATLWSHSFSLTYVYSK